jgi:hypothetical protein
MGGSGSGPCSGVDFDVRGVAIPSECIGYLTTNRHFVRNENKISVYEIYVLWLHPYG